MIQIVFTQGVNRLFVLLFENGAHWTSYKWFFLPTVETKDYSAMIDRKDFFDQPIKNNQRTYDNVRKIVIAQGGDYTTIYVYFKNHCKMIRVYSSLLLFITCPFSKYFQILYVFAKIFKYFALFALFCPFFWKIACMPLLSRIGSDDSSRFK